MNECQLIYCSKKKLDNTSKFFPWRRGEMSPFEVIGLEKMIQYLSDFRGGIKYEWGSVHTFTDPYYSVPVNISPMHNDTSLIVVSKIGESLYKDNEEWIRLMFADDTVKEAQGVLRGAEIMQGGEPPELSD